MFLENLTNPVPEENVTPSMILAEIELREQHARGEWMMKLCELQSIITRIHVVLMYYMLTLFQSERRLIRLCWNI